MTYRFPAVLCSRFSFRLSVRQVVSRVILRGSPLRYTTQCPIWAHLLDFAAIQFRDGALDGLDGTVLIDTLDVHGNDLRGIHVQKILQKLVADVGCRDAQKAGSAKDAAHLERPGIFEGKGCFDNINHDALVGFIGSKVKDARIVKLVYKFLKAGYLEDWVYHKTYSGTPQGGILSPLLANIYLHELDKFVMQLKDEFDTPEKGKITPEYRELHNRIKNLCYHIDRKNGVERESMIAECKTLRKQLLKTPCTAQTDKKLKYIRYADDFIIGVKGSKEDCQWIKSKLSEFIGQTLKMELSEEKTLITHSSECARFLGFDVRVRRCEKVKRNKKGTKARTLNNHVELLVPFDDKIHNFIFSKGIAIQKKDGKLFPVHRNSLLRLTDLEIVTVYNDELRGICNYYGIASNFCKLKYLSYLMEYSCLKTLAAKHKSKISKVVAMYKDGTGEWGIPYETKKKAKRRYFANYMDCKDAKISTDCISNAAIIYGQSVTPLEKRLKARICELCGTTESERYEIHHINKLKNLKGKEPWEIAMLAKRRKTLIVCEHCHHLIHNQ